MKGGGIVPETLGPTCIGSFVLKHEVELAKLKFRQNF